jgi:hypothetical protein
VRSKVEPPHRAPCTRWAKRAPPSRAAPIQNRQRQVGENPLAFNQRRRPWKCSAMERFRRTMRVRSRTDDERPPPLGSARPPDASTSDPNRRPGKDLLERVEILRQAFEQLGLRRPTRSVCSQIRRAKTGSPENLARRGVVKLRDEAGESLHQASLRPVSLEASHVELERHRAIDDAKGARASRP